MSIAFIEAYCPQNIENVDIHSKNAVAGAGIVNVNVPLPPSTAYATLTSTPLILIVISLLTAVVAVPLADVI